MYALENIMSPTKKTSLENVKIKNSPLLMVVVGDIELPGSDHPQVQGNPQEAKTVMRSQQ